MGKKFAIVFPGQGSQSVGMCADLAASYPIVRETFEQGSDALGIDLWALTQAGPKEKLDQTEYTQPVMMLAGIGVKRVLDSQLDASATVMAGHSLGEYTALVASGVLDLSAATRLLSERGRLMQQAVPVGEGAMAVILGLDDDTIRAVCAKTAQGQVVEAVNFNAPGQVVVAGDAEAVARATEQAKGEGARRAMVLDVSVPSHCALMRPAADKLAEAMQGLTFHAPKVPVLHNVNAAESATPEEIRHLLIEQLFSPVRWVETVESLPSRGVEAVVEAGPGKVLTGLVKRIDKSLVGLPVFDPSSLDTAVESVNA